MIGLNILTNSRLDAFQKCRRYHKFRYLDGIRRLPNEALRIGTAVHLGTELVHRGMSVDDATAQVRASYDSEQALECVKAMELVRGWATRWADAPILVLKTEYRFIEPIINPETGAKTPTYQFAGKIDAVIQLEDGRKALLERKTVGQSIDPGSDYWQQLRMDQQITRYLIGSRLSSVLYDVIRKPEIRQKQTETIEDYQLRLRQDLIDRPEFYFARVEVPRTEADIEETRAELWDLQLEVRRAELTDHHYRNVRSCLLPGRCEYLQFCETGFTSGGLPEGFEQVTNIHPELGECNDANFAPAG